MKKKTNHTHKPTKQSSDKSNPTLFSWLRKLKLLACSLFPGEKAVDGGHDFRGPCS